MSKEPAVVIVEQIVTSVSGPPVLPPKTDDPTLPSRENQAAPQTNTLQQLSQELRTINSVWAEFNQENAQLLNLVADRTKMAAKMGQAIATLQDIITAHTQTTTKSSN